MQATQRAGSTRVVLLGSLGGQNLTQVNGSCCRAGSAIAVVVDGICHLFDCGVGSSLRLRQAGIPYGSVEHVFLTHHHHDHDCDLATILFAGWVSDGPGREHRVTVHGPDPTASWPRDVARLHAAGVRDRQRLRLHKKFSEMVRPNEIPITRPSGPAGHLVLRNDRIEVRAFPVEHGGIPSVSYRIKTEERDIVISGDKGPQTSLVEFARGTDTLIHEVIDYPVVAAVVTAQGGNQPGFLEHQRNDHCSPQVCGETAAKAKARRLVLYHLIPSASAYPDASWLLQVRPFYSGPVVVARDLKEL